MKAKSKNTTTKKAPAKKAPTVKATAKKAKATAKPAETQKQAPAPASGEQTRFEMIDIENINSSNNISDLVESIKANGIINPITVSYNKNSLMFDVVAGHRRFAAAKLAGIVKIPCHIIDGKSENELNEIAIHENTIRVDMTPYEECIAIKNLVNKNNTPRQIAARIEQERKEAKFGHVKFKLYANNLRESILTVVKKNMADHLLTLLVFSGNNWFEKIAKSKSWVNEDCYAIDPEDIEKPITVTDIADAVTNNVDNIFDDIAERSYEALFKMMFKDIDPASLQPSDDEVNAEIDRQQAEENEDESDENSDEENDD